MSYQVYNPFSSLGAEFDAGMDYIIKTLPTPHSSVTFDQLNAALAKYFGSIYKPTSGAAIVENMVLSILPNSANSYQNGNLPNESFYNAEQVMLLNSIYDSIRGNDVEGILSVLEDADRDIAESGLSAVDQTPLFAAVALGKSAYSYWFDAIYNAESPWTDLLDKNPAINVANLPFWVIASMCGAISGFAQVQQLDMNVANSLNATGRSVATIVAMLSAVGLSSGKMFFKWVQKVNNTKLSLNKETIAMLNGQMGNGPEGIAGTRFFCIASRAANCSAHSCGHNYRPGQINFVFLCLDLAAPVERGKIG